MIQLILLSDLTRSDREAISSSLERKRTRPRKGYEGLCASTFGRHIFTIYLGQIVFLSETRPETLQ